MFVCRNNYKFNKIRQNGYEWTTDFLSGNVDGNPLIVSWRGNASLDWKEMSDKISDKEIENIKRSTQNYETGGYDSEYLAYDFTQFNFISQQCSQVKNISKYMWFRLNKEKNLKFLISDPHLQLSYRQNTKGISGDILSNSKGEIVFGIKMTIVKKRAEKQSCTQYDSPDGYTQCVEKQVRRKLIEILGCIPPWMPPIENEDICYDEVEFDDEEQAKKVKSQLLLFVRQAYRLGNHLFYTF